MTTRRMLGLASTALFTVTLLGAPALADVIDGDGSANAIRGTNVDDTIHGRGGDDTIEARKGDDDVWGGPGHDQIDAGQGADEVWGGGGNDLVDMATADDHEDVAYGSAGNDRMFARFVDDIFAGRGDDRIDAVYGAKGMVIDCGAGKDVLIFNQPSPKVKRVDCEKVKVISAG